MGGYAAWCAGAIHPKDGQSTDAGGTSPSSQTVGSLF
jgi:hypothetical protein